MRRKSWIGAKILEATQWLDKVQKEKPCYRLNIKVFLQVLGNTKVFWFLDLGLNQRPMD